MLWVRMGGSNSDSGSLYKFNVITCASPGVVYAYDRNTYTNTLLRKAGILVAECRDVAAAVALARLSLPSGGVVLLAPGAASFPVFRDYTERGRAFAAAAGFDPEALTGIPGLGVA